MHVALVSPAWPPAAYPNGIVTYVNWMRRELLSQGHRVSVFSLAGPTDQADLGVYRIERTLSRRILGSLNSRLFRQSKTVFDVGETIASAIKSVHRHDPIDVVEMEESFGWAAFVRHAVDVPVVVKLHGPAFLHPVKEELETPFGQEKVRREGEALAQLPFITAPSRCYLSDTIMFYGLRPSVGEHIVNPVDHAPATPLWDLSRVELNTVLFVGRFDKVKGGDLVLLAFQRLLQEKPDLRLIFVGPDGGLVRENGSKTSLAEYVASMNDSAVEAGLSYRGTQSPGEIAVLRTTALCTVVPSRRESQSYTALEAMLQGCPVVCADNSGLSEIVEHGVTGLKARSEDAIDLAFQIKRILDDPEFGLSLGSAARQQVLKHHAPATVVKRTLDVYQRSIAVHRENSRAHSALLQ